VSVAANIRRTLEELVAQLGDGVARVAPFEFILRRSKRQPMPKPPKDGTFTFIADISAGDDEEEEVAQEPAVFASPYDSPPDRPPETWEEAKRRSYGEPQPPGSTTCEPGPERKPDEFRQRLVYPNDGRADTDPNICFGDGRPRRDELKAYAEKIAGQRTFHRPHERLRTPSVERMIKEDHGG
jgi:hypothetical protein